MIFHTMSLQTVEYQSGKIELLQKKTHWFHWILMSHVRGGSWRYCDSPNYCRRWYPPDPGDLLMWTIWITGGLESAVIEHYNSLPCTVQILWHVALSMMHSSEAMSQWIPSPRIGYGRWYMDMIDLRCRQRGRRQEGLVKFIMGVLGGNIDANEKEITSDIKHYGRLVASGWIQSKNISLVSLSSLPSVVVAKKTNDSCRRTSSM